MDSTWPAIRPRGWGRLQEKLEANILENGRRVSVVVDNSRAVSTVVAEPCDVCGGPTFELNCKIICRRCGYIRDCGDP